MEVFWGNPKKTDEQSGMITWPPPKKKQKQQHVPYKRDVFFFAEGGLPTIFQSPFFRDMLN